LVIFAEQRRQIRSGVRPGSNAAIVAREPNLADWIALGDAIVPGAQIAETPYACIKPGFHTKWRQNRGRRLLGSRHEIDPYPICFGDPETFLQSALG
jgi:hypothetical protein